MKHKIEHKSFCLSKTGTTWRQGYTSPNIHDEEDAAQYQNLCDPFNMSLFYKFHDTRPEPTTAMQPDPHFPLSHTFQELLQYSGFCKGTNMQIF